MECSYIDRDQTPNPAFNKPVDYVRSDNGFVYRYYRHDDGQGDTYNCQFCKLIGRKRDVFECLNPSEWKACWYYRNAERQKSL
jgi:hypothetical protein